MTRALDGAAGRAAPLLSVENLHVQFPIRRGLFGRVSGHVQAVTSASFDLWSGETLSIVGESGCGKTSLARAIVGLQERSSGRIMFDGEEVTSQVLRRRRREIQMIFQDPFASLNPRMTVRRLIEEVWLIHPHLVPRRKWDDAAAELLEKVGLRVDHLNRYPHEFSGGQRQRIGIARCLAARPRLIVCDEPVSALDLSVQAQILNLLMSIQREFQVSYLFISHNLAAVRYVADRVAIMYLGKIVETGRCEDIYDRPRHPYTRALLDSVLTPDADDMDLEGRTTLSGDVPSPANPPSACRFRTRCWKAEAICAEQQPPLLRRGELDHFAACHFPLEG
ncbi:MAG: ABC transporter ATP-binding protein [Dongiaceae bacterium]